MISLLRNNKVFLEQIRRSKMNNDDILLKALTTTSTMAATMQQQQRRNLQSLSMTTTTTTTTSATASHPIVVLAGWMGCHEKSLQRYRNLYMNELGFTNTLIAIASPAMIVGALVKNETSNTVQPQQLRHQQHLQPNSTLSLSEQYNGSLDAYAWDVIYDIHAMILKNTDDRSSTSNSSFIIFHVFSNGGFLLWETIRRILYLSNVESQINVTTRKITNEHRIVTNDIRQVVRSRIKGIVMDSCPAMDVNKLPHALAYISWKEQLDVIKYCGFDYLLVHFWKNNIIYNATHYFHSVHIITTNSTVTSASSTGSTIIPHLFLYSTNDPLSNSIAIDNIVQTRRDQYSQMLITSSNRNYNIDNKDVVTFAKRWETSQHCAHYITHPVEYKNEIEKFLLAIDMIKANTIIPRAKL